MHWLFWGEGSPEALDRSQYAYDSTVGFNETFGFRAGTSLPHSMGSEKGATLEIPLLVMDTAAFYPSYEGWDLERALEAFDRIRDHVRRASGVLTINWHDRSIAFERRWDEAYEAILSRLSEDNVWWATYSDIADFHRARAAARLEVCGDYPRDYKWRVRSEDPRWSSALEICESAP